MFGKEKNYIFSSFPDCVFPKDFPFLLFPCAHTLSSSIAAGAEAFMLAINFWSGEVYHSLWFSRQWFRSAVIKENAMPEGLMTLLFSNIDPIYEFHRGFLKEIEQRLSLW